MTTTMIRGVPVSFPFVPYPIQVAYMEKVLQCLQERQNGVLESPTGTGKTFSLLCASLAWLEVKKAQVQAHRLNIDEDLLKEFNEVAGGFVKTPTIIYASRTHSQLSQAMQELKKSGYGHVKATVIGSREQMCIHDDVVKLTTSTMKVHMCRIKVRERSCHYYNAVDKKKDDTALRELSVVDIEDLIKLGKSHKFCPYYYSKELKHSADIIFTPYNYLLDPKTRKSLGLELNGNVIIFDEGHNIEKVCEESVSMQLKSSDITLCIDEVTVVMTAMNEVVTDFNDKEIPKDFTPDELIFLKEMFLSFEKVLDAIPLTSNKPEGTYFDGDYIFEIFKQAGLNDFNVTKISSVIDKIIQFLAAASEGPLTRKGVGLQLFSDLIIIAYSNVNSQFREKLKKCFKVHIAIEETKKRSDDWLTKATKSQNRVLSYWCFSPGFGMSTLMNQDVHCVILTSGTLAPLKPLISELELDVKVNIENPHIVTRDQICVKILAKGPDNEPLICNFHNRDNPKYLRSLGQVVMNLVRFIPHGVLIFFPSYPIMANCQKSWQEFGIWEGINRIKPIFVEPKDKISFNAAMTDYYANINNPVVKGAIFMGVCRGKVSEGLDFADINGRAVFIVGLPYPPLKDPKVILKKRYLDICYSQDKTYLKGDDWYSLEATRAINQAIGRVIRHKQDYGAIILLDARFTYSNIQRNLSKWLQGHVQTMQNFGTIVRQLRTFFQNAQLKIQTKAVEPNVGKIEEPNTVQSTTTCFDFSTSKSTEGLVNIHKRKLIDSETNLRKQKMKIVANQPSETPIEMAITDFMKMAKKQLSAAIFTKFIAVMGTYRDFKNYENLIKGLNDLFLALPSKRYLMRSIEPYLNKEHRADFLRYCGEMERY